MKKIALSMIVGLASASSLAAEQAVQYQCIGGKKVEVRYQFNEVGIPTQAKAVLKGKSRTMAYDLARSNDEDTYFTDKSGYYLTSDYMDSDNYREQSIMIFSPKEEILFKSCEAVGAASSEQNAGADVDASKVTVSKKVVYQCQNDKQLEVEYGFNAVGLPVYAAAKVGKQNLRLAYDLAESNESSASFVGKGYHLNTDGITVENYRQSYMMLTDPDNWILYKNCSVK